MTSANTRSLIKIICLRRGSIDFSTDMNIGRLPRGSMIKNNMTAADQVSMGVYSPIDSCVYAEKMVLFVRDEQKALEKNEI